MLFRSDWGSRDDFVYGLSAGYVRGPLADDYRDGSLNGVRLGIYGKYGNEPLSLMAALSDRQYFGSPRYGARYQTRQSLSALRVAYMATLFDFVVTPNAGMTFAAFSEKIDVPGNGPPAVNALRPFVGAEISKETTFRDVFLRPALRVAYGEASNFPVHRLFKGDEAGLTPDNTFPERQTLDVAVGFEAFAGDGITVDAEYTTHFSRGFDTRSLNASLRAQF